MTEVTWKLSIAVATFLVGIAGTTFWFSDAFSASRYPMRQTTIAAPPVNSLPYEKTPLNQITLNVKPIKWADKRKIDKIISSFGRGTEADRQTSSDSLVEFVGNNPDRRSYAAGQLIAETKLICSTAGKLNPFDTTEKFIKSQSDFIKLQFMSNALADLEVIEALDTLIDCSNRRSQVGGLSYYNFPTVPAIIKYKEKALPALLEKIDSRETSPEIKLRIHNTWNLIIEKIKE